VALAQGDHYQAMAYALLQLDRSLARGGPGTPVSRIRDIQSAARAIQEVLARHQLLTEEAGGVIQKATTEKPSLIPESKRLKQQHADMLRRAYELDREVELQIDFEETDVELLRLEGLVLRDMLRAHLRRANSLMYEAYVRVEGGEGG
jgi:hypothetical protein